MARTSKKTFVAIRSTRHTGHDLLRDSCRQTWIRNLRWPYEFFAESGDSYWENWDTHLLDVPLGRENLSLKTHAIFQYALDIGVENLFLTNDTTYVDARRLVIPEQHYFGSLSEVDVQNHHIPYINDSAMWIKNRAMRIVVDSGILLHPMPEADALTGIALAWRVWYGHEALFSPYEFEKAEPGFITCRAHAPNTMLAAHESVLSTNPVIPLNPPRQKHFKNSP